MNGKTYKVVDVFLASPGDVLAERQCVREAFDDVNRHAQYTGVFYRVYGWEEQPPGTGRPQEQINPHVEKCDVFVGILWRRWGMDSGKATSGFEEEFELAKNRLDIVGTPEIWLAFKDVDAETMRDPGPQLRKVLDFRSRQIAQREILYSTFSDCDRFRAALNAWIFAHLFRQGPLGFSPMEQSSPVLKSQGVEPRWTATLQQLVDKMSAPGVDMSPSLVARATLPLQAMFAIAWGALEIGSHQMHALFQARRTVGEFELVEQRAIFLHLLNDERDDTIGWWWFRDMATDKVLDELTNALSIDVRIGSGTSGKAVLKICDLAAFDVPFSLVENDWVPMIVEAESPELRRYFLMYASSAGTEAWLQLIEDANDGDRDGWYSYAKFRILARSGNESNALLAISKLRGTKMEAMLCEISAAEANGYASGVRTQLDAMRKSTPLCAIGGAANSPEQMLVLGMMAAAGASGYADGFRGQLQQWMAPGAHGVASSLEHARVLGAELASSMTTFGYRKNPAYATMRDSVVSDLVREFSSVADGLRLYLASGGVGLFPVAIHLGKPRELLIGAALHVLCEKGKSDDVHFARLYVQDASVPKEDVVALFLKHATPSDLPSLVSILNNPGIGASDQVIALVVRLALASGDPLLITEQVALSSSPSIAPLLRGFIRSDLDVACNAILLALAHDSRHVRLWAVAVAVSDITDKGQLEALFDRYIASHYYYDAACWFDRLLNSPLPFARYFADELDRTLDQLAVSTYMKHTLRWPM